MPERWYDPTTWPFVFYVWIGFILIGAAQPIGRWFKRRRAEGWPITTGTIESAVLEDRKYGFLRPKNSPARYTARLSYRYSVEAETFLGRYTKDSEEEDEIYEFIRELEGGQVTVHYQPGKPANSMLSEESLRALQGRRPPSLTPRYPRNDGVPEWARPLLWPFVALSAVGFMTSLWVHINAVLGRKVVENVYFFALHAGIFVVFIPAVMATGNKSGDWKKILRGPAEWTVYPLYLLFAYAFINFAIFIAQAPSGETSGVEQPAIVWRGFSGHWMLFYYAAFCMLLAVSIPNSTMTCINGHALSSTDVTCPNCGASARTNST
jgi:hypothetical protein